MWIATTGLPMTHPIPSRVWSTVVWLCGCYVKCFLLGTLYSVDPRTKDQGPGTQIQGPGIQGPKTHAPELAYTVRVSLIHT